MSQEVSSKSGYAASKKAIKGAGNKANNHGSKEASSEPTTVANNKHAKKTTDKKAARSKGAMDEVRLFHVFSQNSVASCAAPNTSAL